MATLLRAKSLRLLFSAAAFARRSRDNFPTNRYEHPPPFIWSTLSPGIHLPFSDAYFKEPKKNPEDEHNDEHNDMKILRTLAKHFWLKDNLEFRLRVLLSMGLLFGAKVINVQVPFLCKYAVDRLYSASGISDALASSTNINDFVPVIAATSITGIGIALTGAVAINELQFAEIKKVALRNICVVSRKVFAHFREIDIRHHLSLQTGASNPIIDRGRNAINFILLGMGFYLAPTILEIAMVSGILIYHFGAAFALTTSCFLAAHIAFTLSVKEVLHLTLGQTYIAYAAVSSASMLCAVKIMSGPTTVGDLVLISGFLYQLHFPLSILGRVNRETRQCLIDTRAMFKLLEEEPEMQDALTDVHSGYLERLIFDGVYFVVPAGKGVAIARNNGSKSTILRLLYWFFG